MISILAKMIDDDSPQDNSPARSGSKGRSDCARYTCTYKDIYVYNDHIEAVVLKQR